MKIENLDFPPEIIEALKSDGINELNPPQVESIKKGVTKGRNLVVASPTASGKTLVAELAIIKKFLNNEKSVYLVPLKALANEKYGEFSRKYSGIGMKVALSTGDYDSRDDWLGRYDLVILSNEKMDSILRHGADWVKDIKLLVADEIHLMDDASRGPTLEVVITKLRQLAECQTIALSATIKNADEIAKWLNAGLVYSEYRPIKLSKGVSYPSEDEYVIDFLDKREEKIDKRYDSEISLCVDTLKKKKQALIFVSTRKSAEATAEKISKHIEKFLTDAEKESMKILAGEVESALSSPTKQCRRLSRIIENGAAFHHAGLVTKQRKHIEDNFKSGLIKFIVATPTLSLGINLPAWRVVIRDAKRYNSFEYGLSYIPVFEVHQFMGRAGRPRYDKEGEAIIIAKSKKDAEDLKEHFLLAEPEPIYSKLSVESVLRVHVLGLVAGGMVRTKKDLEAFFSKTFFSHQYGDIDEVMKKVEKILDELRRYKFIKLCAKKFISDDFIPAFPIADSELKATRIGKRVAELYIDPLSAKIIMDNIEARHELSYLTVINHCAEMRPLLRVKKSDDLDEIAATLKIKAPDVWDIEYEDFLSALKTSLMFKDWTNESGEDKLLDTYNITPGELYSKVANMDWMLYSAREIALAMAKHDIANSLNKLRLQVKYGVRKDLLELVQLRGIGRVRSRLLWNSGIRKLSDIKNADIARLSNLLGTATAKQIKDTLEEDRYEKFSRIKMRSR